jgi:hypothetical protein
VRRLAARDNMTTSRVATELKRTRKFSAHFIETDAQWISHARVSLPQGTKKRVQNKFSGSLAMLTETRRAFWGVGLGYQFH